ncbi:MAG: S8 family serine peptidase, partial [Candidatus Micrarchaeia archaeon]
MRRTPLLLVLVLAFAQCAFAEYHYSLLRLSGPITEEMKSSVISAGFDIAGYAGDYTYIVRVPVNRLSQARTGAVIGFEELAPMGPELKIASSISSKSELTRLEVLLFQGEDADAILDEINAIAPAEKYNDELITVKSATNEQMRQIAGIQGIMFIDEYHSKEIFNDYAAPTLGATNTWSVLNVTGNGVIVGVGDTGLDTGNLATIHRDIRGRVVNISAWCDGRTCSDNPTGRDTMGHGTHVVGSVLGNGTINPLIKGMAPKARLFMQSIGNGGDYVYPPDDLRELFQEAKNQGAIIHTNSWGSSVGGAYTSDSYYVDLFSNSSKDFTIFFSAGNSGPSSNTIGSPGTAKNAVTIGAVGTARPSSPVDPSTIASFSSRGATDDGRIKPDLVAPGMYILSTLSSLAGSNPCSSWGGYDSYYAFCGGTSMSTPLSAGTGALVTEYLKTRRSWAHPSSALIKAVLVAGADQVPAYGDLPNNVVGFGRINLTKSLAISANYTMNFSDRQYNLTTGQSRTFQFAANASVTPKFALVWTDPACSVNCNTKALVNDLDLKVTLPNGSWYYGNKHTLNLAAASADRVNNVELVIVDSPMAGTYTVTVSAYNVPSGPQDFALVAIYASGQGSSNAPNSTNLTACATLNRSNTIYTLASNVDSSGTCFTFAADNITLDCRNRSITGTGTAGTSGALVQNYDDASVKNCTISGYGYGIRISNSSGTEVTYNSLHENGIGISLSSASSGIISGCTVRDNSDYGISAT